MMKQRINISKTLTKMVKKKVIPVAVKIIPNTIK